MKQKIYLVDAFADKVFAGNPAGVCPLETWIEEDIMQKIAMENNQAETAFFVKKDHQFEIRWFTPSVEVDLCGHATLASAFVLFNYESYVGDKVEFISPRSGLLTVTKKGNLLTLNFPTDVFEKIELTEELTAGFNLKPIEVFKGKTDYLFIYENEDDIKNITPSLDKIAMLPARGVIISAPGYSTDFVSRFFAPQSGVNEDPATGSAHTTLIPYWASQLGKNELTGIQLSARKGYFKCKHLSDRVEISGEAYLYFTGEIHLP